VEKTFFRLLSVLILLSLAAGSFACAAPAPAPTAPAAPPPSEVTPAPAPAPALVPAPSVPSPFKPTTSPSNPPANPIIIMASTTSTGDSGLMDVLIPVFEKKTGYVIKPIYVGSGAAMTMGERGEADVLLVHSPDAEVAFMQAGHGATRKLVMHNDFVIVGPAADPAGIKGTGKATGALNKIASAKALFVSRGDNSGTHQLEQKLWLQTSLNTTGQAWYQQTGQGMGDTLQIANQRNDYTISDRATYLAQQGNLDLEILLEDDAALLNIYHVMQVNPERHDVNEEGAAAFVDFMVSGAAQSLIGQFGVDKFGQPLFVPDAGKAEGDLAVP